MKTKINLFARQLENLRGLKHIKDKSFNYLDSLLITFDQPSYRSGLENPYKDQTILIRTLYTIPRKRQQNVASTVMDTLVTLADATGVTLCLFATAFEFVNAPKNPTMAQIEKLVIDDNDEYRSTMSNRLKGFYGRWGFRSFFDPNILFVYRRKAATGGMIRLPENSDPDLERYVDRYITSLPPHEVRQRRKRRERKRYQTRKKAG